MTRFCAKHALDLIVRGHQCTPEGYEFFCGRKLVTLWSAPAFVKNCPNAAAILCVTEDLILNFQVEARLLVPVTLCANRRALAFGACGKKVNTAAIMDASAGR